MWIVGVVLLLAGVLVVLVSLRGGEPDPVDGHARMVQALLSPDSLPIPRCGCGDCTEETPLSEAEEAIWKQLVEALTETPSTEE